MAIPRLNGTGCRLPPNTATPPVFWVLFGTFPLYPGDCHDQSADWSRNDRKLWGKAAKQQFIVPDVLSAEGLKNEHIRLYFMPIPNPG